MSKFKVTKAKDRAAMAAIVRDIFAASDSIALLEIEPEGPDSISPRCTRVDFIHGRGVSVFIEFDGDDRLDAQGAFCMPWHTISDTDARMSEAFGRTVGGSINPHHFSKCTAFSESFEDLCDTLRRAVACLDSGEAYDAAREAAAVAKNGTWQDRRASFEQWAKDLQAEKAAAAEGVAA